MLQGRPVGRDARGGPRGGAAYRCFPLPAPSRNWGFAPDPGRVAGGTAGALAGELIAATVGSSAPGPGTEPLPASGRRLVVPGGAGRAGQWGHAFRIA
ncbi:hypothetical protein GCM10022420_010490 [Streptomyces iranensis]